MVRSYGPHVADCRSGGENGAFYFRYDATQRRMVRRYWKTDDERRKDRVRLDRIQQAILEAIPGCRVSADQPYREADLAIDFCEDVPALPMTEVEKIVAYFEQGGARAKISSIHVNGWFGDYDKLAMTGFFFGNSSIVIWRLFEITWSSPAIHPTTNPCLPIFRMPWGWPMCAILSTA